MAVKKMPLTLMYITNNPVVAKAAEMSNIDWIFLDLESLGKEERQSNMDTVKSKHQISDIPKIKTVLTKSLLLVRVNPINPLSAHEIDEVINAGADIVMLPYFKSNDEVMKFIKYVNKRAKICLLLETPEAVNNIDIILKNPEIDYIHIGLNDLHLGYKLKFMFELLSNGIVETIINKISKTSIKYGFGGIAGLGEGDLPAELIINEHYRLGSHMAILSRSFYKQTGFEDDIFHVVNLMKNKIEIIRAYENELLLKEKDFFNKSKISLNYKVQEIIERKIKK